MLACRDHRALRRLRLPQLLCTEALPLSGHHLYVRRLVAQAPHLLSLFPAHNPQGSPILHERLPRQGWRNRRAVLDLHPPCQLARRSPPPPVLILARFPGRHRSWALWCALPSSLFALQDLQPWLFQSLQESPAMATDQSRTCNLPSTSCSGIALQQVCSTVAGN